MLPPTHPSGQSGDVGLMSSSWTNLSIGPHDDEAAAGPHVVAEDVPACASCRKRKLRCSRETPTCSHCLRLSIDCIYNPKQKPGLKTGALDALSRRVAFLERILLDVDGNIRPQYDPGDGELEHHDSEHPPPEATPVTTATHSQAPTEPAQPEHPKPAYEPPHEEIRLWNGSDHLASTRKRKLDEPYLADSLLTLETVDIAEFLPSQPLLLKLVDYFCISFHHWIPYKHKQRLRDRVCNGLQDPNYHLVYHALVAVTLRHLDRSSSFLDEDEVAHQTRVSRHIVETYALKTVSLESLRALIMIVFDYLNDGEMQKAWPLIGSLTRTIDYLQLTVEPSASQYGALMRPLRLVQPTHDWTELEERRRLFWVIFLLDRFCSVSTGWNFSLTSEDVHRRLPADGGYFTREEPVTTPYFGIWNKAAARIGKSLANVPAQYNEDDPVLDQGHQGQQGASPGSSNGLIDASKLGAFAYCVEATESLSQVTTFFLQQRINWQDKEHAVSWLTRFKELDLRLVQWKLFLPPRWKDSNISPNTEVVDMDPNLTLAHITHNTSMILLHHSIAYPAKGWNDYVALPKECSAQTCEHAAVESSNIVEKFLSHTPIPFVNVQFAFCAFVAAKALLFDHQVTRKPVRSEFPRLIRNLWDMSRRWARRPTNQAQCGDNTDCRAPLNQPGKYAAHLEYLYEACQQDLNFRFDLYDHSCLKPDQQYPISPAYTSTPQAQQSTRPPQHRRTNSMMTAHSPLSPRRIPSTNASGQPSALASMPFNASDRQQQRQHSISHQPPIHSPSSIAPPYTNHPHSTTYLGPNAHGNPAPPYPINGTTPHANNLQDQSLLSLEGAFMDSQFLDMDRVITFEEANFFLPGDAYRWQQ